MLGAAGERAGRRVGAWLRLLWAAPRSAQLGVIWRIVGLAMVLLAWRTQEHQSWAVSWRVGPPELHAMTGMALALTLLGPRLVVLLGTCAAWAALLRTVHAGDEPQLRFIADEYLLFAALPGVAAVSTIVAALEHRPASDGPLDAAIVRAQLWLLRLGALGTLGFATLHKLNADFLDPAVSCAVHVGRDLVKLWGAPAWLLPSPGQFLALEGLTPVLLVFYPGAGVVGVAVLALGLGHTGPFAFATLLVGMSLAFVGVEEAALWSARWRRAALIFVPVAAAAGCVSAALYRGREDWRPYLALELVIALVVALLLVTPRAEPRRPWWRPRPRERPWLPGRYAQRSLCVYAALLLVVNGLSPYLGLKFRYSFAMVSNLRADDSRWNSLVVPRWLRLRADPLVHVDAVYDANGEPAASGGPRTRLLLPGVYSPQELARRVSDARRVRAPWTLELRHRGVARVFADFAHSVEMQRFVAALPERRLFQDLLTPRGRPQKCVH